jgi:hypothetical protein
LDDGSTTAHGNVALDYLTNIVGGAILKSHITGNSHYTVQSYYTLSQMQSKLVGGDLISSGACSS